MSGIKSFFNTIKALLIFSYPIVLGQLGQMLIGAGDVFVAAHYSSNATASISIANAILTVIFFTGFGLLQSIAPILSKKRAEQDSASKYLNLTLIYCIVLSLIFTLISLFTGLLIPSFGFDKNLIPDIQDYMYICSFSFLSAYIYQAIKEYLQSYEKVFFANFISILAIFINLILAWGLVFGFGIIPPLGLKGLGLSALIVRAFMGISLIIYCHNQFCKKIYIDVEYIKDLFKIGYPIALGLFLELMAFSLITLIIGKISSIQVATHNIVLTLASITFMVPLSISDALSVKIAYSYGQKNYKALVEYLYAGLTLTLIVMGAFASVFFMIPEVLIKCFSLDKNIIVIGSKLLFIAGIFQIFDGTQITLSGALRGLGFTKSILLTMILSYWLVGIPLGLYLAFEHDLNIFGLWIGLALSLFTSSIVFGLILLHKVKSLKIFYSTEL